MKNIKDINNFCKSIKSDKLLEKILSNNLKKNINFFQYFNKDYNLNFEKFKKFRKFKTLVVVGMGGSVLGTKAINSFLQFKIKKDIIFFDNIDDFKINKIKKKLLQKKILFILISKSGNTLETLSISNLLSSRFLKKNNTIIISEKNNNPLHFFSKKKGIEFIKHNDSIGGRYSVLSEVGMFPSYLLGLKLNSFHKGKISLTKKNKSTLISMANDMANKFKNSKYRSLILLNYCPVLNEFLYWYQQLVAESLGKKGKGLLPVVSPAPRDHHSLLQLYLDGPKDKLFYIFSYKKEGEEKLKKNFFGNKFKNLNKKSINEIANIQKDSLIDVFKRKKIPFRELRISAINEETLSELFSYFMLETFLIGSKMKINPFDQPAVEEVKKITLKKLNNRTKNYF